MHLQWVHKCLTSNHLDKLDPHKKANFRLRKKQASSACGRSKPTSAPRSSSRTRSWRPWHPEPKDFPVATAGGLSAADRASCAVAWLGFLEARTWAGDLRSDGRVFDFGNELLVSWSILESWSGKTLALKETLICQKVERLQGKQRATVKPQATAVAQTALT